MTSRKTERFNSLLKDLAASFLMKEKSEALTTITRVETSDDLKSAKIFISIFPESKEEEALKNLEEKTGDLQNFIGSQIKTKFLPRLEFEIDNQGKAERKIDELLKMK